MLLDFLCNAPSEIILHSPTSHKSVLVTTLHCQQKKMTAPVTTSTSPSITITTTTTSTTLMTTTVTTSTSTTSTTYTSIHNSLTTSTFSQFNVHCDINVKDLFFVNSPAKEMYQFKLISNFDEKFDVNNFNILKQCQCDNIIIDNTNLCKLYATCNSKSKCLKLINLDNLDYTFKKNFIKSCMIKKNKNSKHYMLLTKNSFANFIDEFKILNSKSSKICYKSFTKLLKKDDNYRDFETFTALAHNFYKLDKKDQIQILKILSCCHSAKSTKFQNFQNLSQKKIISISYVLKIIKNFGKSHFLKSKRKKKKRFSQKKILDNDNCLKIGKQDLDDLLSSLQLQINHLNLKKLKNMRYSSKYYYLDFEEICQNIFFTNRLLDIYFILNKKTIGTTLSSLSHIHNEIKNLLQEQRSNKNIKDSPLYISEEAFYDFNSFQNPVTLEAEIRHAKAYLQDMPKKNKIKMLKNVQNEEDLKLFERRLEFILDISENSENIKKYEEFKEFKNFFDVLEKIKEKTFYKKEMPRCLNKKRKPIKSSPLKKTSLHLFENKIKVEKSEFWASTQDFVKEIKDHILLKKSVPKLSQYKASDEPFSGFQKHSILESTKRFMRRIGF